MSNVLRLAIVDPDDSKRSTLKSLLLGMDVVWLEAECSRYEFFSDVVGQTNPDIGVVSLDDNPEKALALMQDVHANTPECSILCISSSTDGQLILQAMRAGAKEFLTYPIKVQDLASALDRINRQKVGAKGGKSRSSTVVAIAGATGGVGSTSLAVNLGCMLAHDPANTAVLVDLDLSLGDADVFLDAIPEYTLVDVSQNISRLDFTLLKRSLTKHTSGLYLLPRPVQLQDTALVTTEDLRRVIGLLKASFTHVILDLSKSYTPIDQIALEEATKVLLVTQLDLPCLRNVVRLMMSFDEIEGLKEKVHVIVNRAGMDSGQISLKKAEETIGREIFWQIPNDYRTMVEVRNNGVPLLEQAPRANITQAVASLADLLDGEGNPEAAGETDEKSAGVGRWLNFFGKSGKSAKPGKEPKDESQAAGAK